MNANDIRIFERDMLGYIWFIHETYGLDRVAIIDLLTYSTNFFQKLFNSLEQKPLFMRELLAVSRGYLSRKSGKPTETDLDTYVKTEETLAATKIQAWWKMVLQRRRYQVMKTSYQSERMNKAVVTIQRAWRFYSYSRRRRDAALKIQRWWLNRQTFCSRKTLHTFLISSYEHLECAEFSALRRILFLLNPNSTLSPYCQEIEFFKQLQDQVIPQITEVTQYSQKIENKFVVLRSLSQYGLRKASIYLPEGYLGDQNISSNSIQPYANVFTTFQITPEYIIRLLESMPECLFHNCDAMQNFQRVVIESNEKFKDYPIFAGQLQHLFLQLFNWGKGSFYGALLQSFIGYAIRHVVVNFSITSAPVWLEFICSISSFSANSQIDCVRSQIKELFETLKIKPSSFKKKGSLCLTPNGRRDSSFSSLYQTPKRTPYRCSLDLETVGKSILVNETLIETPVIFPIATRSSIVSAPSDSETQIPFKMDNLELLLTISKRFMRKLFGIGISTQPQIATFLPNNFISILRMSDSILQSPLSKERLNEKSRYKFLGEKLLYRFFQPIIMFPSGNGFEGVLFGVNFQTPADCSTLLASLCRLLLFTFINKGFTNQPLASLFNPCIKRWHLDYRLAMHHLLSSVSSNEHTYDKVWNEFCINMTSIENNCSDQFLFAASRLMEFRRLLKLYQNRLTTSSLSSLIPLNSEHISVLNDLNENEMKSPLVRLSPKYFVFENAFATSIQLLNIQNLTPLSAKCLCCHIYRKIIHTCCVHAIRLGPEFHSCLLRCWTDAKSLLSKLILLSDGINSKELLVHLNSAPIETTYNHDQSRLTLQFQSSTPKKNSTKNNSKDHQGSNEHFYAFKEITKSFQPREKMLLLQAVLCDLIHGTSRCGRDFWNNQLECLNSFSRQLDLIRTQVQDRSKLLNRQINTALTTNKATKNQTFASQKQVTKSRVSLFGLTRNQKFHGSNPNIINPADTSDNKIPFKRKNSFKLSSPIAGRIKEQVTNIRKLVTHSLLSSKVAS